jgi:ACR3 family arsenite transporter
LTVPFLVLLYSVLIFIVIPLALGSISRTWLIRSKGKEWFEKVYVNFFHPITIIALLATLILIFAFQSDNITERWIHVILIAIPLLIQVYFNSSLTYGLMKLFKVEYSVAATRVGRRACDGGWRVGGSAGDAFGLFILQ